ncbi:MAG TPA: XdhC family protein [Solirubrobacteraceae bacterium]|jgi:xanthine dehydrogenase accessory factor|nr:XdhC family protein [Solirubrobacteraceae bacterium]
MDPEWVETSELHGPAFEGVGDPSPRLVLFGAVELSAAMSRLARAIGWRSYVVDPRAQYLSVERFPDADELICAWPEEAFARIGGIDERTAVAVLTHDPVLDDPALVIALRAPALFVGGMGSRRTQERRRARLMEEHGLSEEEVARLSGPIGLDLGARTAHETALSILGEIVAVAHGRDGGRLRAAEGPIREARAS